MNAARSNTVASTDAPEVCNGMAIGEVIERLEPDFPGISTSKIRFLEDRGLVAPNRTAAGYRKFTDAHVERLRLILVLQRDHYLPLREIRAHLDALDSGQEHGVVRPRSLGASATPPATEKLRRPEVIGVTGISEELLDELVTYGLIKPTQSGFYSNADVVVCRLSAQLASYGIEARHLRSYLAAAEREHALIEQIVSPLRHQRESGQSAETVEWELCRLSAGLHAALLGVDLSEDSLG